jgi:hypothetical protein
MPVPNPVAFLAGKRHEQQIDRKCAACEMENEEEEAKIEISRGVQITDRPLLTP